VKSLKYSLPVALATWWIPILDGVIVGFVTGFYERRRDRAVSSALISSIAASALYVYIAFRVLTVPVLGNLLPVLSLIFSVVGISISVLVSQAVSSRTTFSVLSPDSAEMEFYAKSNEEIEKRLEVLGGNCGEPIYEVLSEDKVVVRRKCNGYDLIYEILREGKGFRVKVRMKGEFMA